MIQKTMPRGVRRFISHEKARIRKTAVSKAEEARLVRLLYERFKIQHPQNKESRNNNE